MVPELDRDIYFQGSHLATATISTVPQCYGDYIFTRFIYITLQEENFHRNLNFAISLMANALNLDFHPETCDTLTSS